MQDFFGTLTVSPGTILSRDEMKTIKGGTDPIGPGSKCAATGEMCHVEGGITYTCYTEPSETEGNQCCCGHSAGDWTCYEP